MKRKKKANFSVPTVICGVIAVLTIIWIGDSAIRGFRRPSTEIVCIDDRETEAETAESVTETYPFLSDAEQVSVQEANLDFGFLPSGYIAERKPEQAVHDGLLLQIDSTFSGNCHLVDFQNKNEYYHLKYMDLRIQESALRAMNALTEACFEETGCSNFIIYSTTESYQAEGSLYPDVLPDRSTGFCLDLAFLNEDGTISRISADNAPWLNENAYRFGFVQSIPEAGYHLRYVGKLHAYVMKEYQFTLPEYLQFLREYSVTNPYYATYGDKQVQIYFVPAAAFGSTDIPVPENREYEISGNDTDGFIVWAEV